MSVDGTPGRKRRELLGQLVEDDLDSNPSGTDSDDVDTYDTNVDEFPDELVEEEDLPTARSSQVEPEMQLRKEPSEPGVFPAAEEVLFKVCLAPMYCTSSLDAEIRSVLASTPGI